ncbi:hypothetical protein [Intrasporangium sp.]|uniref:hypothetical protein n=1 Tax=Intrasporangium sp. TaxID=1925024 RepID=UPI0033659175
MRSVPRQRRELVATAVGMVVGGVAYVLALFDYRFDPTRTAVRLGYASNFFDLQAEAFLNGRIDVPTGSLGIEGFVVDGKTYMYFPPFPALIRIPVMLVTRAFDGRLSLLSMAVAWVLFAVMTAKLVWLVRRVVAHGRPVTRFEAVAAAVFLVAATGGTVLTFDASLPWVYHEVYVWAVALVVAALYWLLRTAIEPNRANALWLTGFALAAGLTRTPGGWAIAIGAMTVGLALRLGRLGLEGQPRWRLPFVAGLAPLAVAIGYNLVKFGHPFLFPLEKQVWTSVNAHRRDALEANGGTITGLQFFPTSFVNYFRPDGIRLVDYFPFITLPGKPAEAHSGAFLDQSYRTGSITAFMPLLVILSLVAVVYLARRTTDPQRRALRPVVFAGVLVSGGVMAYGYLAYRYTSEFVPGLVVAGAVGLWAACEFLLPRGRWVRRVAVVGAASLAAISVAANMLTAHASAAVTWRGEPLRSYVASQLDHKLPWTQGVRRMVTQSDSLPADGVTDQLHVVGDCEGLYLHTGDAYEPWVLVERRADVVVVEVKDTLRPGRTPLFTVHATKDRLVHLETKGDHFARVVIANENGDYAGPWFPVYGGGSFRVGISVASDLGYAEVTSTPGGFVGYVPFTEWNENWEARPGTIDFAFRSPYRSVKQGITLHREEGLPLTLCRRLVDEAG